MNWLVRKLGIPGLITVAVIVAAAGFWVLKERDRTSQAKVESHVTAAYPGSRVHCTALQPNSAAWACAVVYRAESECVLAKASVLGSLSQVLARGKCDKESSLAAFVPNATGAAVAADVDRISSIRGHTCVKLHSGSKKWACAVPGKLSETCVIVKVRPWTPFNPAPGGGRCAQVPGLKGA